MKQETNKDSQCYVILIHDRHCDPEVEVYMDKAEAISRAREIAKEYCRHEDDYKEMQIADWPFYAQYSCEDDYVRVIHAQISPNPHKE